MSAHTSGPWKAVAHHVDIGEWDSPSYGYISCKGKNAAANARLIAAAPELYEAAKAAWNCIAELPPTQARVEVAQMLQAALAKAQPRSNDE